MCYEHHIKNGECPICDHNEPRESSTPRTDAQYKEYEELSLCSMDKGEVQELIADKDRKLEVAKEALLEVNDWDLTPEQYQTIQQSLTLINATTNDQQFNRIKELEAELAKTNRKLEVAKEALEAVDSIPNLFKNIEHGKTIQLVRQALTLINSITKDQTK